MPKSPPPRAYRPTRAILLNLAFGALVILLSLAAFRLDRQMGISLPRSYPWLALPLMLAGIALIVWASQSLLKHSGATGAPGDPTPRLVTAGPYRFMRNPIYAGSALELLGVALFSASPIYLAVALLFVPVIQLYIVKLEEPRTAARLGEEYKAYRAATPRWLPRLRLPTFPTEQ
ncbi:MAG: isoprenylcysteine carboxylmethyltransferase family protein [Anaerolineae bacterium]|nr:isoprenylcysteine carboxylmethyltransferase family protein [Anaerolineae bacterium]